MNEDFVSRQDVQKLICRLNDCIGIKRNFENCKNRCPDFQEVNNLPSVQSEEQAGHWFGSVCTVCGGSTSFYYDCQFCPKCGARIEDEND